MPTSTIARIVDSYRDPLIRWYSRARFLILRQPFLEELDQWLPASGRLLDLGSGFGLFSLYFAITEPGRHITGVEIDARRVAEARRSASALGVSNAVYHIGDVTTWQAPGRFDGIYMLDVLHHLPKELAPVLLARLADLLETGGVLLLKEVANRPRYKMWFTLVLDRLMVGGDPIHYWAPGELTTLLKGLGLDVKRHAMNDILPYPHVLYICHKTS